MAIEQFDAVLAEMRAIAESDGCATHWRIMDWADRLAAAHAAEVGERDDLMTAARLLAVERAEFRIRAEKAEVRAEAAERLYAEIEPMYQQQGLNIVRLQKELEAAERDARQAVGLLRECSARLAYYHPADIKLRERIDACMGEKGNG